MRHDPIKMRPALGELVTVLSANGTELEGILYRAPSATTIIHIHGSFGNFYQGRLIKAMARVLPRAGLNLLSVNMSGHDGLTETSRKDGRFEYGGGAIVDFSECVDDIAGTVEFALQFSDRVILQGHSLGCDRVLHFAISRHSNHEIVLLAPCDSFQLQTAWISPETVGDQIDRLQRDVSTGEELEWLPLREYGVSGKGDWTYAIPVTRRAFLAIATGEPYRLMRISAPASFRLPQRALVCIGGKDDLQTWPASTMFSYLRERLGATEELLVPSADHMFADCEEFVAATVATWANQGPPFATHSQ